MRKVRIGNDINVRWEVKTDGQAVSLEGKALKLFVRSAYRKEEITTFTVEGCVVSFTYPASMQRATGARAVILEDATEGAPRRTVCADQAFTLVAHSCEENDDDVEFEDFMVSLQSNVLIGKPGLSAYEVWLSEGNTGTLEDWYAFLRKPATDIAADVAAAEAERKVAETARQEAEEGRITSEQERTTAETARDKAEQARQGDENLRKTAEENRVSAETDRNDAEQRRTANEKSRETAEQMRKTNEADRIRDEKEREAAETSRKATEKLRDTAENDRDDAEQERRQHEDARADAEGKRDTAETLRKQAETGRNNAEQERTDAEQERTDAELLRKNAETKREQAEEKREETIDDLAEKFGLKADKNETIVEIKRLTGKAGREWNADTDIEICDDFYQYLLKRGNYCGIYIKCSKSKLINNGTGNLIFSDGYGLELTYDNSLHDISAIIETGDETSYICSTESSNLEEDFIVAIVPAKLFYSSIEDNYLCIVLHNIFSDYTFYNEYYDKNVDFDIQIIKGFDKVYELSECVQSFGFISYTNSNNYRVKYADGRYALINTDKNVVIGGKDYNANKNYHAEGFGENGTTFTRGGTLEVNGSATVRDLITRGITANGSVTVNNELNVKKSITTKSTLKAGETTINGTLHCETHDIKTKSVYPAGTGSSSFKDPSLGAVKGNYIVNKGNLGKPAHNYDKLFVENIYWSDCTNFYDEATSLNGDGLVPIYERKGFYGSPTFYLTEALDADTAQTSFLYYDNENSSFCFETRIVGSNEGYDIYSQFCFNNDGTITSHIGSGVRGNGVWYNDNDEDSNIPFEYIKNLYDEGNGDMSIKNINNLSFVYDYVTLSSGFDRRVNGGKGYLNIRSYDGLNGNVVKNICIKAPDQILYIESKNGTSTSVFATDGSHFDLNKKADLVDGKVPLSQLGNVDTQIVLVVDALPTENIKSNKIYLVKNTASEDTENIYTEYVYINNKWEELGKYKPEVDLSEYVKSNEIYQCIKKEYDSSKRGAFSFAIDDSAMAGGKSATAVGVDAKANYNYSTALGYNATVAASDAVAVGTLSSAGWYAIALGTLAHATGKGSIALGPQANVSKNYAIAIGKNAKNDKSIFSVGFNGINGIDMDADNYGLYLKGFGGYTGTNLTVNNAAGQEVLNPDIKSVQEIINSKADITPIIASTDAAIALQPNKKYEITAGDTLTLTLTEPVDSTVVNEYKCAINTGNNVPTTTLPQNVIWATEPVIEANKHYEISIIYSQKKYWGTIQAWNLPTESTINNQSDN